MLLETLPCCLLAPADMQQQTYICKKEQSIICYILQSDTDVVASPAKSFSPVFRKQRNVSIAAAKANCTYPPFI